jgi:hypothetical protein
VEPIPVDHALRKLFAGLTEHAFMAELGVTDTRLIDYVTELLARFVHADGVFPLRDAQQRPIKTLASMAAAAETMDLRGEPRREVFRHLGDVALFWTGVFPESLAKGRRNDVLVDYCETGKRSYYLASTYSDTPKQQEEAPILRRLSVDFETCMEGLRKVRGQWSVTSG